MFPILRGRSAVAAGNVHAEERKRDENDPHARDSERAGVRVGCNGGGRRQALDNGTPGETTIQSGNASAERKRDARCAELRPRVDEGTLPASGEMARARTFQQSWRKPGRHALVHAQGASRALRRVPVQARRAPRTGVSGCAYPSRTSIWQSAHTSVNGSPARKSSKESSPSRIASTTAGRPCVITSTLNMTGERPGGANSASAP